MANTFPITVQRLPAYTGLDGENADNLYRAGQRKAFLGSEVVSPFVDALKTSTGYSDDNIPDRLIEMAKDIGDMRFVLKVTPTKKRPGYKDVFDELDSYLRARMAEYKAGNRPVGILTLDGEPYISANDMLGKIKKAKNKVTAEGVKIQIEDPEMPEVPDSVVVPLGMDLRQLTAGNASRYLESCALSGEFGELMRAFEDELTGLAGFDNAHAPKQTEHMYRQVGSHVFHVSTIPYQSTSYGKVMDGLDKEPGKKPESGGDLVLVTKHVEIPRLRAYDPKDRDGETMVRLKGLVNRMDKLIKDNTDTKVRQPIGHYPAL